MAKLMTWFDVETVILRKKFAREWPEGVIGISVYPDEVEVRIKSEDKRESVSLAFQDWFGPRYKDSRIYLESPSAGDLRALTVSFEAEPEEEPVFPKFMKPDFASFSLYPEVPPLKGPDFKKLANLPPLWAFYSFKGGVSRTVHLVSLVKALSEKFPEKPLLIVDADLEAPGLTWWAEEQYGKPEISFLDFLALAHYDESEGCSETLTITHERLRKQMLVFKTKESQAEHFFLPAFREKEQLMRMPLRPEHVAWEQGKEWIISELLGKLAKKLDVHAVVVDLRAGLSEISSPLLLDPRVNRVIITTTSSQSVYGTELVLEESRKISNILNNDTHHSDDRMPILILSMIKEELKGTDDIEKIKQNFSNLILPPSEKYEKEGVDALLGKDVLYETLFDEKLLHIKSLEDVLEKLDRTDMYDLMSGFAEDWFALNESEESAAGGKSPDENLKTLCAVAKNYEFAESGEAENFLVTRNLKNLGRKFENSMPLAVVMGAKGAGKTYSYLQLTRLNKWSRFVEKVGGESDKEYGFIWPLMASLSLGDSAKKIIQDCQTDIKEKTSVLFSPFLSSDIEDRLEEQKKLGQDDRPGWRNFWLKLMAASLSCKESENPLAEMQQMLKEKNEKVVFLIDGLEDIFQKITDDESERAAIQALCQSVIPNLQEWPDNRIGLLVFVRKDIIKSAIRQNFGQFESLYQSVELKWNWEEALRLVAWLVSVAANLKGYVKSEGPLENVSGKNIEHALTPLWGVKLGKPDSREAYTANWIIAALSDFNGQLQARDMVRLIRFAAENALEQKEYRGRLLPPAAIKNALDPCSEKKVEEIQQEVTALKEIFQKLKDIPSEKRQIPFEREQLGISSDEIRTMETLGVVTEYEGKYYLPEIFRRGLGFRLEGGARPKVLTLLKRSGRG
ncbi:hypothetical protein DENIS_3749 [Desulfonema ishimotonii]|uniref:ParA family protein n=1 Tax=Desulfonema ishimotonii TaxID=45657 RepID=A0A401G0L4_9BACT|nr:hypothetical protein [Desulfonema ishimotonii]GBC62772.1 hypothetical protein DENIS_3749 [Desulfonema ishimotonii]